MTAPRIICFCVLAAVPAFAQVQARAAGAASRTPLLVPGPPAPKFEWRLDPPDPDASPLTAGYTNVTKGVTQSYSSGHRYFYDDKSHTYFGYDLVIVSEPEPQADTYRATFYDLSVGPLDFLDSPHTPIDPALWKKIPLATVPAPMVIHSGDMVSIEVFVNPGTHQKLMDSLGVYPTTRNQRAPVVMRMNQSTAAPRAAAAAPEPAPISGTARDFSVEDAGLHLRELRLKINGTTPQHSQTDHAVNGPLVWFYSPEHGRYILSLAPRTELGFVRAGEVRGDEIDFTIGTDEVSLDSPDVIAPGDAPYTLYVLHDPSWKPTGQNPGGFVLLGTVSARELAALMAK